ncbi:MAG: class I adenylate-forming enzyme family protein [Rhizobiaceae bacterium]
MGRSRPRARAFFAPDGILNFEALAEASLSAARWLHARGVRSGDRVALLIATADRDYLAFAIGTMRLGAVAVCANARYKAGELAYLLGKARPVVLIASQRYAVLIEDAGVPDGCDVVLLGDETLRWEGPLSTVAKIRAAEALVDPDAPARIIFTSGTTANPKGCIHSQAAMLHQGRAVAERLGITHQDRFWTPLPMFHTAGWSSMLAAFSSGASLHHPGIFEAKVAVDQLHAERCTIAFPGFETIWLPVLDHAEATSADLGSVRLVIIVGIRERLEAMQARLPNAIQVANTGSTEACGWLAIGSPDDDENSRWMTCGKVLPGMEVRLVDQGTGRDAEEGELLFRGPGRLSGYFDDPEGTAAAIDPGGWFHSGDLMRRTGEGELVFVSRLKDMLKVGGENVAAAEIEGHLLRLPGVRIAQVVSAPDGYYGEVPAAFIETESGMAPLDADSVVAYCLGKISTFKVPRYVRFVTEWPMSGTKIKKAALRQMIADELRQAGITTAPRPGTSSSQETI